MLKEILVVSVTCAVLASPVNAATKHHTHHQSKLEKDLKKIGIPVGGGAAGYAVGGPIGAAVGAGAGYLATHDIHKKTYHASKQVPSYPGYKYYQGYYYDGLGHRYTLQEIVAKHGRSSYRQKAK